MGEPERKTTDRFDNRRVLALERIARSGDLRPELTLGQLIAGALAVLPERDSLTIAKLLRMSDHELADAIDRYVLMPPDDAPPRP